MLIRNPRLLFNGPDGAPAGGGTPPAASVSAEPTTPLAPAGAAPATGATDTDYKAKYEETLRHSREWEARSKENFEKAQKFDAAEAEKKTEIEKANDRATTAEKQAAENNATILRLTAATEHGITKDELPLLTAATAEGLAEQVAAITALRAGAVPPVPPVASAEGAGITGGGTGPVTRAKTLTEAIAAQVASK